MIRTMKASMIVNKNDNVQHIQCQRDKNKMMTVIETVTMTNDRCSGE